MSLIENQKEIRVKKGSEFYRTLDQWNHGCSLMI